MTVERRSGTQTDRDIIGSQINALRGMMHRFALTSPEADVFIRWTAVTHEISLATPDGINSGGVASMKPDATTQESIDSFIDKLVAMNDNPTEKPIARGMVVNVTTMLKATFEVRRERVDVGDVADRGVRETVIFHGRNEHQNAEVFSSGGNRGFVDIMNA